MSQRMYNNFRKRFGDRIEMRYLEYPLEPTEQKIRNTRLREAYKLMLTEILKREPTKKELLGLLAIEQYG